MAVQDGHVPMGEPQNGHLQMNGSSVTEPTVPLPHPGRVFTSTQYLTEEYITRQLLIGFPDSGKEIHDRFEGVDLIDSLVEVLGLPLKTFDTACTFYHKTRLLRGDKQFLAVDAAVACLFVACKAEDTLKKSRELLCAHYNLKMVNDQRSPDDKIFEKPSLVTQGLERVVLEANSFDFRCRYPQKCMIKLMKEVLTYEEARNIYPVALNMSIDMYKTFMPLKNTNFGMAYSLVELAARITGEYLDKLATLDPSRHSVPRMRICQGMLDLLELYTKHHKQTKLGARFGLDKFIQIKIDINNEIEEVGSNALPRCPYPLPSNEDLHATPLPADLKKVTNRFVFDVDEARREQAIVKQHFEDEYVMVDVEVEVEDDPRDQVPDRPRDRGYNLDDRGHGSHRGGQDRGGRHGGGDGWSRGGRRGNDRRRRGRGGGGGGGGW